LRETKLTEHLGKLLPKSIATELSIENDERTNCVIILLTIDENGFSRPCLLSPYQVVSTSRCELYFQIYKGSHTDLNLKIRPQATFIIQNGPGLLYVQGVAKSFKDKSADLKVYTKETKQAMYRFKIAEVLSDKSESAPISSLMKFETTSVGPVYQLSFENMRRDIAALE
jgi:hypothetical protein